MSEQKEELNPLFYAAEDFMRREFTAAGVKNIETLFTAVETIEWTKKENVYGWEEYHQTDFRLQQFGDNHVSLEARFDKYALETHEISGQLKEAGYTQTQQLRLPGNRAIITYKAPDGKTTLSIDYIPEERDEERYFDTTVPFRYILAENYLAAKLDKHGIGREVGQHIINDIGWKCPERAMRILGMRGEKRKEREEDFPQLNISARYNGQYTLDQYIEFLVEHDYSIEFLSEEDEFKHREVHVGLGKGVMAYIQFEPQEPR